MLLKRRNVVECETIAAEYGRVLARPLLLIVVCLCPNQLGKHALNSFFTSRKSGRPDMLSWADSVVLQTNSRSYAGLSAFPLTKKKRSITAFPSSVLISIRRDSGKEASSENVDQNNVSIPPPMSASSSSSFRK
jgi:hypothetical protein